MLSSQNCMNDLLVASIVGHEREAPCVISGFAVALWEPGKVVRRREPEGAGHSVFRVGELHGKITPRVEELVELLGSVDGAYATSNIWGERWSKLALNAASNPVVAITGLGAQGFSGGPACAPGLHPACQGVRPSRPSIGLPDRAGEWHRGGGLEQSGPG